MVVVAVVRPVILRLAQIQHRAVNDNLPIGSKGRQEFIHVFDGNLLPLASGISRGRLPFRPGKGAKLLRHTILGHFLIPDHHLTAIVGIHPFPGRIPVKGRVRQLYRNPHTSAGFRILAVHMEHCVGQGVFLHGAALKLHR